MLIYYGVYSDIGIGGIILLSALYLTGGVTWALLKRKKLQIIVSGVCISALILCETGMVVPTPTWLVGDGYAVTQQLSLIIASYLAPIVLGMITYGVLKFIFVFIKRRREKD